MTPDGLGMIAVMPELQTALTSWADGVAGDLLDSVELAVEASRGHPHWIDDRGRRTSPMFLRHRLVLDIPHTPGDNVSAERGNDLSQRLADAAERDPTMGGVFSEARVERNHDNERNPFRRDGFRRLVMDVVVSGGRG